MPHFPSKPRPTSFETAPHFPSESVPHFVRNPRKDRVDLDNAVVWIPDSKTPNGVAEVPLTPLAVQAFQDQLRIAGPGTYLFPSDKNQSGHQTTLKTVWHKTLKRAKIPYFGSIISVRRTPRGSGPAAWPMNG